MPQPVREVDRRKAPLESRWTRNRRLLKATQPAAPPPPPADYVVTGEITPDATGSYNLKGTHGGENAYERQDGAYWIWFSDSWLFWHISDAKDQTDNAWFDGSTSDPAADYNPLGTHTGIATVAAP